MITQEDKELLLIDLCARLPYQPLCKKVDIEDDFCECDAPLGYSLRDLVDNKIIIKPYLRPMSSMTEEEYNDMFHQFYLTQEEFFKNCSNADTIGKIIGNDMVIYDWLLKNHFDFRGLIPSGLAIAVTEDNNPYKN